MSSEINSNGEYAPHAFSTRPRMLLICATEPDEASGTPVIVCDLLSHFPPNDAEVICDRRLHVTNRRAVKLAHRVRRLAFPSCLWPLRRGSRVRRLLEPLQLPWLVLVGIWRVLWFRPTCLIAIYYRTNWILGAYLISRLTRVPLVYYIHDALRENLEQAGGWHARYVAALEAQVFRNTRVMVLHPYLADNYRKRYGIECTILRQVTSRIPRDTNVIRSSVSRRTIGFSGAIYEHNVRQIVDLATIVTNNSDLELRIWTGTSAERLAELGICGPGVQVSFECDYDRLLERLAACDLLYLPLAFADSQTLTTSALQYAFPTKTLDYLIVGRPIWVHCPSHFELSRFFIQHPCAYVLNEGEASAMARWLNAWQSGEVPETSPGARQAAIELFSPQKNRSVLWRMFEDVSTSGGNRWHRAEQAATNAELARERELERTQ